MSHESEQIPLAEGHGTATGKSWGWLVAVWIGLLGTLLVAWILDPIEMLFPGSTLIFIYLCTYVLAMILVGLTIFRKAQRAQSRAGTVFGFLTFLPPLLLFAWWIFLLWLLKIQVVL